MSFNKCKNTNFYFQCVEEIAKKIDKYKIEQIIEKLLKIRKQKGRIFLIGVGGSAANCSHAVNDFRKLCGLQTYSPCDNFSEMSARINDEGWNGIFKEWLKISNINSKDGLFILSVGGGNKEKKVSENIIEAINYSKKKKAKIFGIVGRDGGYTKKKGDYVLVIPTVANNLVTPLSESFQAVVWHSIVSSPLIQIKKTKCS